VEGIGDMLDYIYSLIVKLMPKRLAYAVVIDALARVTTGGHKTIDLKVEMKVSDFLMAIGKISL
jgi:hypothetical protein